MNSQFDRAFSDWCRYAKSSVRERLSPWARRCARWEKRIAANPYRLTVEEYGLLRQTDFPFAASDGGWMDRYVSLWRFRQEHGHCLVTSKDFKVEEGLSVWVGEQRQKRRKKKLSPWKQRALNRIGFSWDVKEEIWQQRLIELKAFIPEHGHMRVPERGKFRQLAIWVTNVRNPNRRLRPKHQQQLKRVGFVWSAQAALWQDALAELKKFASEKGHGNVPHSSAEYPKAAAMLATQRQSYKEGTIAPDKRRQLEALGVRWNLGEAVWNERYEELCQIYARLGHVRLPKDWPENRRLERWLRSQRERSRWHRLAPERRDKLAALGIRPEWSGKRGGYTLKELVLNVLKETGPEGMKVEAIAQKVKAKPNIVAVWFHDQGRKLAQIEKIKRGWYRYRFG